MLVSRGIYPARDFQHLIEKRTPDIFITYDWRENVLAVRSSIRNALSYCLGLARNVPRDVDLEDVATNDVTFWLDWIFLDQTSRNVDVELDSILPILFRESTIHAVVSATALSRAWCCYELAHFTQRATENRNLELTSLIPGDLQTYPLWESVAATDPADKMKIESRLRESFSKGLVEFEFLMVQAGLAADLKTETGVATARILAASEAWVTRFISKGL